MMGHPSVLGWVEENNGNGKSAEQRGVCTFPLMEMSPRMDGRPGVWRVGENNGNQLDDGLHVFAVGHFVDELLEALGLVLSVALSES